jgi:hypothetical protein
MFVGVSLKLRGILTEMHRNATWQLIHAGLGQFDVQLFFSFAHAQNIFTVVIII